ncbi:MAG: hypothetical protein EXS29_01395 [Pedosphaera sp.]|nr:hypothetical protein [Pedosphaera sp.]MSS99955.1 hypothetical protein [Pedosphaera sp.]
MKRFMLFLSLGALVVFEVSALPVREALALVETGAEHPTRCPADSVIGGSGEVSRFQIMPDVWRGYSKSGDYNDPEAAWKVAQQILDERTKWFRRVTGREPNKTELYVLWNKPGHFESVGFKLSRVKPLYRERAERFSNLCHLQATLARKPKPAI